MMNVMNKNKRLSRFLKVKKKSHDCDAIGASLLGIVKAHENYLFICSCTIL